MPACAERGGTGSQKFSQIFRWLIGGESALMQAEVAADIDVLLPVCRLGHQRAASPSSVDWRPHACRQQVKPSRSSAISRRIHAWRVRTHASQQRSAADLQHPRAYHMSRMPRQPCQFHHSDQHHLHTTVQRMGAAHSSPGPAVAEWDLVIVDLHMPDAEPCYGLSGLAACQQSCRQCWNDFSTVCYYKWERSQQQSRQHGGCWGTLTLRSHGGANGCCN